MLFPDDAQHLQALSDVMARWLHRHRTTSPLGVKDAFAAGEMAQ